MTEHLILVDENDKAIGTQEKMAAHQLAQRHRAFSVFIYRENNQKIEVLLQQRNPNKYHCGGLWTNTTCGHPRPDENTKAAAQRRLYEEMGIAAKLTTIGVFEYCATFDNGLTEHEIDHVFRATLPPVQFDINPDEVSEINWINTTTLLASIDNNPESYTPWLKQALNIFSRSF